MRHPRRNVNEIAWPGFVGRSTTKRL
jgi:hypothetical protein